MKSFIFVFPPSDLGGRGAHLPTVDQRLYGVHYYE